VILIKSFTEGKIIEQERPTFSSHPQILFKVKFLKAKKQEVQPILGHKQLMLFSETIPLRITFWEGPLICKNLKKIIQLYHNSTLKMQNNWMMPRFLKWSSLISQVSQVKLRQALQLTIKVYRNNLRTH
jgi:hypothetical protein